MSRAGGMKVPGSNGARVGSLPVRCRFTASTQQLTKGRPGIQLMSPESQDERWIRNIGHTALVLCEGCPTVVIMTTASETRLNIPNDPIGGGLPLEGPDKEQVRWFGAWNASKDRLSSTHLLVLFLLSENSFSFSINCNLMQDGD